MDAETFCSDLLNIDENEILEDAEDLVKASISIFAQLPMVRQAIIEYYSHHVFEKAIADYVSDKRNLNAIEEDFNTITTLQSGLTNLVLERPDEFASVISVWSIQLLGKLSQKYERTQDTSNSKKHWRESEAVLALLSLAAVGFWKTTDAKDESITNDDCVDALLDTYVKYSPAVDWIVARLATSYTLPLTTRVLFNGLSIYQKNTANSNSITPIVLILEQLVDSHFSNLNLALRKLIQWSFIKSNKNNLRRYVIPYIFRLSASQRLLPLVYKIIFDIFTSSDVHLILSNQKHHTWTSLGLKYSTLIDRVAEMVLKINTEPLQIIFDLLEKSADSIFALHVTMEILNKDGREYRKSSKHYPLIKSMTENGVYIQLCKFIISLGDNGLRMSFLLHLLNYIGHSKPTLFPRIIHYLLYHITSINKLSLLLELVQARYYTAPLSAHSTIFDVLQMSFIAPRQSSTIYAYFWENLCNIIQQEQRGTTVFLKQNIFTKAAAKNLLHILRFLQEILENKLKKVNEHHINEENEIRLWIHSAKSENDITSDVSDKEGTSDNFQFCNSSICDNIAKILEMLDINTVATANGINYSTIENETYRKLVDVIVKYFFCSLLLTRSPRRKSSIIALRLLSKCCSANRIGRLLATQLLVDGAVFKYSLLFGATAPIYKYETQSVSLFDLNIKQGFTSQMSQRHLAVFRNEMDLNRKMQSLITETCYQRQRLLLEALSASMSEQILIGPSTDALTSLSLWLVESVSTDVMYNGLPWPEEEFTKITMERDLHIRRMFRTTPVLWSLLRFVAMYRPSLCYCSVLLRGLTSVLIYQWLSWSYKSSPDAIFRELHCTTKNILEILSLGQLLPAPLDTLAEVMPKLNALEISVVLRDCVWFYMRENVPAPILFLENQLGQSWRDTDTSQVPQKFMETLRTVMQKHLPDLASSYNQIFIQCPPPAPPASAAAPTSSSSDPAPTEPAPTEPAPAPSVPAAS